MHIRRQYQVHCPVCSARPGRPCHGKEGETLASIHFQRVHALRAAAMAALKILYSPLTPQASALER